MKTKVNFGEIIRFIIVGILNTGFTYVLYLILLLYFPYSIAYTISYFLGIIISYLLNTFLVFKQPISIKRIIKFPIIYVVQYLINLLLVFILVDTINMNEKIALLISIAITFPITFILTRYILKKRN
ncbi:polysaccharide synthesis protein GtrA [Bacillus sp. FJAT-26390]|nr:polysaccharide synthesis protein GtrA [Bacillus sp. FJAT-26390]